MSAAAATAVGKARALRGVQHSCVRGTARVSRPQRWRTTAAAGCPFATSVTPSTALAPPAPWAADAPAPVVSLFESIGGDAAVQATVDLFYTRVPVDPELSRFFEGADIKKLRGHQVSFLTMAFGGPKKYNGGTIALAHKKMIEDQGLNSYHFDIVVGHLVACLKELGVAQSHIDEVVAIVQPLREAFPDPKADAA